MSGAPTESELLTTLTRIADALESIAAAPAKKQRTTQQERAALAFVAIQNGARNFTEVGRELGISRATAARNPGIRRALETLVTDRRVSKAEGDDLQWQQ